MRTEELENKIKASGFWEGLLDRIKSIQSDLTTQQSIETIKDCIDGGNDVLQAVIIIAELVERGQLSKECEVPSYFLEIVKKFETEIHSWEEGLVSRLC